MTPQNTPENQPNPKHESIAKFLDFVPLIVFFIANKQVGIMGATQALLATTVITLAIAYMLTQKIAFMPLFTGVLLGIFGGLTIYFNDDTFIKMKPTIVSLLFAGALFASYIFKFPIIHRLMGGALKMTRNGWQKLTWQYGAFFVVMAGVNEIVWRTQSTDTWVNFKVFGFTAMTIIFFIIIYQTTIAPNLIDENTGENNKNTD